MVGSLLMLSSLAHCSENLPTTNPVQAIRPDKLETGVINTEFTGMVAAMASWCAPCRKEMPILADLYRKYNEKGFQIIAVSVDADGVGAVQPLVNNLKIPFPVYWVGTEGISHYQLAGIPTLMIYRKGKLIEKLPGIHPRKYLEKRIKKLMTSASAG